MFIIIIIKACLQNLNTLWWIDGFTSMNNEEIASSMSEEFKQPSGKKKKNTRRQQEKTSAKLERIVF